MELIDPDNPIDRIHAIRKARESRNRFLADETATQKLSTLKGLDRDGWNLDGMTDEELDTLESHVDELIVRARGHEIGWDNRNLLSDGQRAVRHAKTMRELERQNLVKDQMRRFDHMRRAADHIESALEEMGYAESIKEDLSLMPRDTVTPLTADRARAMGGDALNRLIVMESTAEDQARRGADANERRASLLEKHGGAGGKRLAKTLRAAAEDSREAIEAHHSNVAAARAELGARAERAKSEREARESIPETARTVEDLLARVAELEGRLSVSQQ